MTLSWSFYSDPRPALVEKGWAPGGYANRCRHCGSQFTGDKRASSCADCAYSSVPDAVEVGR